MKTIPFNFLRYYCHQKSLFQLRKIYFSTNPSFWLLETFYLVETVCFSSELFLYCWKSKLKLERSNLKEKYFLVVETIFFDFLARRSTVFCYSGNVFFKEFLFSLLENYSSRKKLILWLVETISCPCLRYFLRNPSSRLMETHFSVQKKTYCCLLRAFFSASGNHYLRYKEAYSKLLLQPFYFIFTSFLSVGTDFLFSRNSILLFTDFFRDFCKTTLLLLVEGNFVASRDDFLLPFSDIPPTVSFIFLTDINVFLKQILHSVRWKPIFCLVETFLFHFTDALGS